MSTTIDTAPAWTPLGRAAAATTLTATGVLWAAAGLLYRGTGSPETIAWATEHPFLTELGLTCDLVAIPFLFWTVIVWLRLARPNSPRLAWTGAILLTCAVAGQGVVSGVEIISYVVGRSGRIDVSAFSDVINSGSGLPMTVFMVMFMAGALGGILVMVAALWRSRAVPRTACALLVVFQVADTVGPPLPYVVIAAVALAWMALSVARARPVPATP